MQSLLIGMSDVGMATIASGFMLVSPWKAVLLLVPFVPWAWVVAKIFDKHAAAFYLPRENWNAAHLVVGMLAVGVALFMPMQTEAAFWAGWGAMILLLFADIAVFMYVTNRDERVPETKRLKLDLSKIGAKKDDAKVKGAGKVTLLLKSPDKHVVAAPAAETPEYQVRVAAETLYTKAMASRATQVDIAPVAGSKDPAYQITMLVDGVRTQAETVPAANAVRILDFWKSCAKLDVNERRKRQVGDVTVEQDGGRKKVRVMSSGSTAGLRGTLLFDPEAAVRRKSDAMGLLENQAGELKAITSDEHGVVLLAAPLDGGRTTTFYAVLKMHDAYTRNIQTVEVEIQDTLEGVKQNLWEMVTDGPEFSTLVRSILRRDPDIVGVGELPDQNTAKEVARADHDRTRTYISLRADHALQAVTMWMKAVGDLEQGAKPLKGVVAQKLLRKLCTNCRVAYQPSPDMIKKLGLPADRVKQLFKKGGQVLIKNKPEVCPVCGGGGYVGQEGAFEVFRFTDEDRALLAKGDLNSLKVELRKRNLPTIQQAALRKAVEGVTSVEELLRVTAEAPPPQAPQSGGGAQPPVPAKA